MKKTKIGMNILSGIFFGVYLLCNVFYNDIGGDIIGSYPPSIKDTVIMLLGCFSDPTQFNGYFVNDTYLIVFFIAQIVMIASLIVLSVGSIMENKKLILSGIFLHILYILERIWSTRIIFTDNRFNPGYITNILLLIGDVLVAVLISKIPTKRFHFSVYIIPVAFILISKIYRVICFICLHQWPLSDLVFSFPFAMVMCLIELLASVGAYFLLSMWLAYPEGFPARVVSKRTPLAVNATEELKTYKQLLEAGAITQEEFDAKKKQLLGL